MGTEADEAYNRARRDALALLHRQFEVTVEQFGKFVEATKYVTQAERDHRGSIAFGYDSNAGNIIAEATWRIPDSKVAAGPRDPVAQVNWDDAAAYAKWAGLELVTEAQWEYAAAWEREGKRLRPFPWGELNPDVEFPKNQKRRANLCDDRLMTKYNWVTIGGYHGLRRWLRGRGAGRLVSRRGLAVGRAGHGRQRARVES